MGKVTLSTRFKIFIIVPHYGDKKVTEECLDSLAGIKNGNYHLKTIVVDNGTGDSFKSKLGNHEIIRNDRNIGFAAAVNIGIRKALGNQDTRYILILNNDTVVPNNLFKKLLFTEISPESSSSRLTPDVHRGIRSNNISNINRSNKMFNVDIISPVIKFKSIEREWVYDYGGKINWWIGRPKHIEVINNPITQSSNPPAGRAGNPIDYVSGACMLVRREVFEKIGLFDERFFFYFEDVDFCTRAKMAGFKIEVNQDAVVEHKLGSAIGRWSNKAIYYNIWGNFIFINKHLGWRKPIGWGYLAALSVKIIIDKVLNYSLSNRFLV